MTLDSCIKRYEIWASDDRIEKDIREEHEQIAEWLKDYKRLLDQEPCEDTISRQQAIDKMQELEDEDIKAYGCEIPEGFDGRRAIKALKILPPVKPKSEKGHWIEGENGPYCDNCGNGVGICYKFCPCCGRDMREYTT